MKYAIRLSIAAVAACIAIPLAAQSADLPSAPVYNPPPPIVPAWTGCYVGVNVGGGWAQASVSDPVIGASLGSVSRGGIVGDGQIGCDYQVGLFVIGFQGMADATNINGSGLQPNGFVTSNFNVRWIETLTARFGIAVQPTALLYVKGGGAWAQDNVWTTAFGVTFASATVTSGGWTIGGGVEFNFAPNWSVFLEYDYLSFGNQQIILTTPVGIGIPINFNHNVQTVLVGVNFRFSGGY